MIEVAWWRPSWQLRHSVPEQGGVHPVGEDLMQWNDPPARHPVARRRTDS